MKAACMRFVELVDKRLEEERSAGNVSQDLIGAWRDFLDSATFRLSYDTSIPQQVGLAGSSALVVACLRALSVFFGIPLRWLLPLPLLAQEVLDVERELSIAAGLQDRVAQIYEGLVCMDFAKRWFDADGHGEYERMPLACVPAPLYLAHLIEQPSDSNVVHSDLRQRWESKDAATLEAMQVFISLTERARRVLEAWPGAADDAARSLLLEELADIADRNFDTRLTLLGRDVVRQCNIDMVECVRACGYGAKFTGSGGAIVCVPRRNALLLAELRARLALVHSRVELIHPSA